MTSSPSAPPPQRSTPPRRRFDATWLPFGMMIGFVVGMGMGMTLVNNLFLGALIGVAVGAGFGILLGRRGAGGAAAEEDALDEEYRRTHGDQALPHRREERR